MTTRNWKRARPNSLLQAMELCLDYAREKHNRSAARVADLMGVQTPTLYKWLASGRLPANLIRPFEHACGATFVTWWICQSAHKLVIDIPVGRKPDDTEINSLQANLAEAIGQLIRFYKGDADADQTVSRLTNIMSELAYHRENVARQSAPELSLFDDADHA